MDENRHFNHEFPAFGGATIKMRIEGLRATASIEQRDRGPCPLLFHTELLQDFGVYRVVDRLSASYARLARPDERGPGPALIRCRPNVSFSSGAQPTIPTMVDWALSRSSSRSTPPGTHSVTVINSSLERCRQWPYSRRRGRFCYTRNSPERQPTPSLAGSGSIVPGS
jgi:hypothetical protein